VKLSNIPVPLFDRDAKAVDLFSGCGGLTLAAEGEGVHVTDGLNHWDKAVEVYAANHPKARAARENLCGFDFATLEPFNVLLAGPACQPSSQAGQVGRKRSKKVFDDHMQMRATLWAVLCCLRVCRPKVAIVENVPPVDEREDVPEWLAEWRALDYTVTDQLLCASRFGDPQRRWRRFFIGVHEHVGEPITVANPDAPEPGADQIFDASAKGWVPISKMRKTVSKRGKPTARERAEIANAKLGGRLGWGVHVSHRGAWGRPASEPIVTLTTKPGQLWWVRDGMYRQWTDNERKAAFSFPRDYDLCGATKEEAARLLGNAVPVLMGRAVIRAALAGLHREPVTRLTASTVRSVS
jgi:site-specific DNA-cytosine methylase